MKVLFSRGATKAFTLVEVLVVIALIVLLLALLTPSMDSRPMKATRAECMNNLRQIGLGFVIWSNDHSNQFPWRVSITNGGTMEKIPSGLASPHFQILSEFLPKPKMLVCPTDTKRRAVTNFAVFTDQNLSYFANLDAGGIQSVTVLAGDRHLQTNGVPGLPGLFTWTKKQPIGWTRELHSASKPPSGCLVFCDGHVEATSTNLTAIFEKQGLAVDHLAVP